MIQFCLLSIAIRSNYIYANYNQLGNVHRCICGYPFNFNRYICSILGLVFRRRDRIVQTCDHSYVIIAIMLHITYCLSQMRLNQYDGRVSKKKSLRRKFYFSNFFFNFHPFYTRSIYLTLQCFSLVSYNV